MSEESKPRRLHMTDIMEAIEGMPDRIAERVSSVLKPPEDEYRDDHTEPEPESDEHAEDEPEGDARTVTFEPEDLPETPTAPETGDQAGSGTTSTNPANVAAPRRHGFPRRGR